MADADDATRPNPRWAYTVRFGIAAPSPTRLAEFETWYEDVHLPRLLAVPGVHSATRYTLRADATGAHHLTVYEIDGPEVLASAPYLALPGWEHWRPLVVDWHRAIYQLHDDLGDRGRER